VRRGGVTLWAWMASIAVHIIILAIFGVSKFSQSAHRSSHRPVPTADITQVKRLIEKAPVTVKPKVKKTFDHSDKKTAGKIFSESQIFNTAKSAAQSPSDKWDGLTGFLASQDSFSLANDTDLSYRIKFFGSWTDRRKICYLVDCSGSMRGIFSRVKKELKDSISSLQPDQYFNIIFFGDNRLFEFEKGRLVRATGKAKSAAHLFIDAARPIGQTNAWAAMERAVRIRDDFGKSPSVVYFLTDGFELTFEDTQSFAKKITKLLRRSAPSTVINTIGFWPQNDDRKMLQLIAEQSKGEFVYITDSDG